MALRYSFLWSCRTFSLVLLAFAFTRSYPPQLLIYSRDASLNMVMLSVFSSVLSSPPTPFLHSTTSSFRLIGFIFTLARAGEGLPSSGLHFPYMSFPLHRWILQRCFSRLFTSSMVFAHVPKARLPLVPFGVFLTMRQDSLYVTTCKFARTLSGYLFPALHTWYFDHAWQVS